MAGRERHTIEAWHRREAAALFGAYPTRMMLALVASIALVAMCFHLPLDRALRPIGWQVTTDVEQPLLDVVDLEPRPENQTPGGAPITRFSVAEEAVAEDDAEAPEADTPEALASAAPPPVERLKVRQAVLDFAEEPPDIVGGLGAYYIHIEYPEEAIAANIQGRLILTFVVEPDGRASEIKVLRSLHPLCDSSAVRALRRTRFVPGRQNGEAVRVRMRLPVKFKLVDAQPDAPSEPVPLGAGSKERP